MKILVVGTGGVGGFFGAKLARAGNDVWFVARGNHLKAMQERGLQINSTEGNWRVPAGRMIEDPAEVANADVILFCVKTYDTDYATRRIAPTVGSKSVIINLQNGVDNEARMAQILNHGTIFGGLAFIYATITEPGTVTESGGVRKLTFGPMERMPGMHEVGTRILDTMHSANISSEYTTDIRSALWKKFVFISAVSGLTATTRLTIGEILSVAPTRRLLVDAMEEVMKIAKAKRVHIEENFVQRTMDLLQGMKGDTHSSLYYDLVHGKQMEVEALSGAVVRYGREEGIATPIHTTLYASLLPYHLRHEKRDR